MSHEILKGVPLPNRWQSFNLLNAVNLEIGDCILIRDQSDWKRYRHCIYRNNKKKIQSPRFTSEIRDGVLLIWRIA